jgi:hypothetical protein
MIELLLAAQTAATAALAFFVIMIRRELYPMLATAGPVDVGFWIRSADVLVLAMPQFEVSKTVIKIRWLTSEELFLRYRIRVYDVAMHYSSRGFYKRWKAWLSGDDRYRCLVKKPRGLAKIYSKAIEVVCYDMEDELSRKFWEVIEIAERHRRKHKT